jgi:hypothetical protein
MIIFFILWPYFFFHLRPNVSVVLYQEEGDGEGDRIKLLMFEYKVTIKNANL